MILSLGGLNFKSQDLGTPNPESPEGRCLDVNAILLHVLDGSLKLSCNPDPRALNPTPYPNDREEDTPPIKHHTYSS